MRIAILTTLWKRPELSRIVLEYYRDLEIKGVEFVLLAVGSDKESKDLANDCGWSYVKAKNAPLSNKWNAGCETLKGHVDAVLIVGSDDLLNKDYFTEAVKMLQTGQTAVGLDSLHYYSVEDGRCVYMERAYPGAGIMIAAVSLDKVDWRPWQDGVNRRIDGHLMNKMHQEAYPFAYRGIKHGTKAILIDIKTEENIWTFNEMIEMIGRATNVDGAAILDKHFPSIREKLNHLPVRLNNV